ncbi:UDP-N-acetylglucosamine transporter UGNT1-like [Impatiens glandulifera]|uniref:UDP-N-acetylglucosamine transporter UGNT1-like n=1 Tax=Impatiens glandulifera TaxID=253017 RepID=UPI001FB05F9C|nr:UDP-N-acetylglucosamine transporter UGNT1-like [Impatiens glandulifera]
MGILKPLKLPITCNPVSSMKGKNIQAAIAYMFCAVYIYVCVFIAVLLIIFNKAVLSSFNFPYANVITLFQITCSCFLLYVMRFWKIISFSNNDEESNTILLVPFKSLLHTIPLASSYLLYMLASMESVRGISIPMYTALRRTTIALTMVAEYLLVGKKHSYPIIVSVAVILLGAFVAGAGDLSFDLQSYTIVFISNICTAVYLALVVRIVRTTGLNSFGIMWCNGLICGPVLLIWTLICGDLEAAAKFDQLFNRGFQVVMMLSCIMAFMLNYTVYLNTTLNSPLTQSVCGNLKDLLTIGFGWILFGGLPFDSLNVVGQSIGFLGALFYAYCKLKGK